MSDPNGIRTAAGMEVAKDGLKTPVCCQKIQQKSKAKLSTAELSWDVIFFYIFWQFPYILLF